MDQVDYLIIHPGLLERPDRMLMLAAGFAVTGIVLFFLRQIPPLARLRAWPCFVMAVVWVLFAKMEAGLVGQGYNIRLDMIIFHPVLTLLSVLALVGAVWPASRASRVR
ncbi:hypothetical protein [Actinoplanes couchii]|uniref:Integral membrane protein n=1 Tax=Actinoplanes couchii TaxID=403638 RepID=A0ABQ3XHB0_9ACTN|nr:hypothetical protein [Actinoplanes couchii]MDR6320630.1 hypothetical protein [Actinoplanes couchii]GID57884.1 hypothetical protein Aco03nite_062880 [Actinoplanes couchii]